MQVVQPEVEELQLAQLKSLQTTHRLVEGLRVKEASRHCPHFRSAEHAIQLGSSQRKQRPLKRETVWEPVATDWLHFEQTSTSTQPLERQFVTLQLS